MPGGEGSDLDLAALIQGIQSPPVAKIGVMDVEAFFPSKDRFALAMKLNNLLAAPGFQAWLEGAPLDIQQLLYTASGKPRLAIFSIAHLSDAERMFFVTLLLSQMVGWMRAQSGTTSLRALLYMDEIFGYFPAGGQSSVQAAAVDLAQASHAPSGWASSWRRRIPWTSITKGWPTPAPGSSAVCKRSATKPVCSKVWKGLL